MPPKKKPEEAAAGAPEWMCTFSDMMSLLLCFFVLLFSMSSLEKEKFVQAIGSIQGALGRIPGLYNNSYVPPISIIPQKSEPVQRNKTVDRAKEAIAKKARSKLVADESSKEIIVEGVREGIRFSVSGRLLFDSGMAMIKPDAVPILNAIADTLSDFPTLSVRVEGYTDNSPVPPNSAYTDNWKLAQARAFSTMLFLRDRVNPPENRVQENRFSIMSSGSNRPRFPNDTPEHQALNRRVEIVLLQGPHSETITGVLEGSEELKIDPEKSDFEPIK